MDPITILAGIKTAHATVKMALSAGKELHEMAKEVSAVMNGVADLTKLMHAPPKGWHKSGSAEELALKAFTARMEAGDLEREIRSQIVGKYGVKAWEQIQREVVAIRKAQRRAAEIAAIKRAQDIEIAMAIGLALLTTSLVVWFITWLFRL